MEKVESERVLAIGSPESHQKESQESDCGLDNAKSMEFNAGEIYWSWKLAGRLCSSNETQCLSRHSIGTPRQRST